MSDAFYVARSEIEKVDGLHRRATVVGGVQMDFGVHGPVRTYYKLDSGIDRPLPVDYLVAAAGG